MKSKHTIKELANIREEYGNDKLLEHDISLNPLRQFEIWLNDYAQSEPNTPNAMVLSTVDEHGFPDSRVVLLKGLDKDTFVFYTNYYSAKGLQLDFNPKAALNFYWPLQMRQVRIRGYIDKVSDKMADEYFHSRPVDSQLSAIASPQSREISGRDELCADFNKLKEQFTGKEIHRPEYWGGYQLTPIEVEFWQGRDNRLHDRIKYYYKNNTWSICRLAP
ncbi:MAG: pyridoxamine 5'-phosphate oxidase [Legionellales bacterium RIFCSPHIGHO2_12_FULL_35_11]|nr:MAG: pyridoxamine 5'-phosphate oxidase [Legionellales bacterium RIFCSPHIGHO2_12_FULL_35_11]